MSQENVERLRSFFQTWDPWEWAKGKNMSLFDPDLVYEGDVLPDQAGESYRGHEGLARATRQWLEPFEGSTVELERIIGAGDDLVSVQRGRGKMRHTGIQFDQLSVSEVCQFCHADLAGGFNFFDRHGRHQAQRVIADGEVDGPGN